MITVAEKLKMEMPSLKAIAIAINVRPNRLYAVAKKPQPGVIYDPRQYNWEAITKFVEGHFTEELTSLKAVIKAAAELDLTLAAQDNRSRGPAKPMIDAGGGRMVVDRRKDFEVGSEVAFKKETSVLKLVFKNDCSMVFESVVPEDRGLSVMSNSTFNQKYFVDEEQMKAEIEKRKAEVEVNYLSKVAEADATPAE